jgi:hypothetical protein
LGIARLRLRLGRDGTATLCERSIPQALKHRILGSSDSKHLVRFSGQDAIVISVDSRRRTQQNQYLGF